MHVAIVGAGIGGRSLYRFLELDGMLDTHDVEIFDLERPKTHCHIHPCAWGVKTPEWKRVCGMLETKPRIQREFTRINRNGTMIRCELCTIDKPIFLDDICPENNIQRGGFDGDYSKYDLVVDATGEKRAVLPPIKNDMKITCRQALFKSPVEDIDATIIPSKSVGYSWIFPLKFPFVHIGQGAMDWDFPPPEIREAMEIAGVAGDDPLCGWNTSKIRLMSPRYSYPISPCKNVVGVGEAAGCVSPNNGAGILPGIISARMLADYILDNSSGMRVDCPGSWGYSYETALIRKFGFLDRETEIVRKLINNKRVGIRDLCCLYRNTKYFGMYPGMREVISSLKMVGARFL
jgi:flavin-dependent dehydrogenase